MSELDPIPPSSGECRFCHRPLPVVRFRVNGQPACEQCAQRVSQVLELNQFRGGPFMVGLLYGLAAAILCGFIWAVIVKITNLQIGIVAVGIGFVVTRAIIIGAKGRRGTSIQIIAIILSLLGVFVGKGLIASWVLWDQIAKSETYSTHPMAMRVIVFVLAPILTFDISDLIWYGIAAYQAFRMARPIRLVIEGPTDVAAPGTVFSQSPIQQQPAMSSAPSPAQPQPQPIDRAARSTPLPRAIMITLVSAFFSVYVYQRQEGWVFATGSVLCILVHELGHTIACLLYGLPASSPIFIPYVGALISLRAQPPDAKVEAVIGIAGPIGGLLAATVCFVWYHTTHSHLAASLVQFGALINLFNLLPIHPLDGGRIARGVAPGFWMIFTLPVAAFCALAPKMGIRTEVAILLTVIMVVGVGRTIMARKGPYYDISALAAWTTGIAYAGVAAILLWMWTQVRDVGSIF